MLALREYAERENVRGFVVGAVELPGVHGVTIDIDPRWYFGWAVSQRLLRSDFEDLDRSLVDRIGYSRIFDEGWLTPLTQLTDLTVDAIDYNFRPQYWRSITSDRGGSEDPFIIRVRHTPRADVRILSELSVDGLSVILESAAVPRAIAKRAGLVRPIVGGVSIGDPTSSFTGTLGGILADANGASFALTSGHVLSSGAIVHQPAPSDSAQSTRIGACVAATKLAAPTSRCSPYGGTPDKVDIALIELDLPIKVDAELLGIGPLPGGSTLTRDMNPQMAIELSGKVSGHRKLRTGGLAVTQQIEINGSLYCFRDLFEIVRLSRFQGVTGTLSPPVQRGDSGAWVVRNGPNGYEWCGVVTATDSAIGYAIFAEFVMDWLVANGWPNLAVA